LIYSSFCEFCMYTPLCEMFGNDWPTVRAAIFSLRYQSETSRRKSFGHHGSSSFNLIDFQNNLDTQSVTDIDDVSNSAISLLFTGLTCTSEIQMHRHWWWLKQLISPNLNSIFRLHTRKGAHPCFIMSPEQNDICIRWANCQRS